MAFNQASLVTAVREHWLADPEMSAELRVVRFARLNRGDRYPAGVIQLVGQQPRRILGEPSIEVLQLDLVLYDEQSSVERIMRLSSALVRRFDQADLSFTFDEFKTVSFLRMPTQAPITLDDHGVWQAVHTYEGKFQLI